MSVNGLEECEVKLVDWRVALSAVLGLTVIGVVALLCKYDGLLMASIVASLAGAGGFAFGIARKRDKGVKPK